MAPCSDRCYRFRRVDGRSDSTIHCRGYPQPLDLACCGGSSTCQKLTLWWPHVRDPKGLQGKAELWLSCVFYNTSIPLVIAVILLAGGGLLYGFWVLGRIRIRLLVIIGVGVVGTCGALMKSVFTRRTDDEPGEPLDIRAHPRLSQTLEEVVEKIGTRKVDTVYVTAGTDLSVMERGGVLKKVRGATERCLILGVGVLERMRQWEPSKRCWRTSMGTFPIVIRPVADLHSRCDGP